MAVTRDIFNRRTDVFGGSFSSDDAFISFPNVGGLGDQFAGDMGLLIQQLTTAYQQQVTRLYEVGRPAIYYVGGRTSGDAAISRVIGPRTIQKAFYDKFGDVCQAETNSLQIEVRLGCGTGPANSNLSGFAAYTANYCVIVSVGLGVRAEDNVIREDLRLMFSNLQYQQSSSASSGSRNTPSATSSVNSTLPSSVAASLPASAAAPR